MKIEIRQEKTTDYDVVFDLIEEAFKGMELSDHKEQFLVQRLRKSAAFIPELSLVAEYDGEVIGHILLTKLKVKNENVEFHSLALAPVSVSPRFQKKGVGRMLIEQAHNRAAELGFESVILLGHEDYYPRFGYKKTSEFGIKLPFDVPDENCMAIELKANALRKVSGVVQYPKEFFDR